MSIIDRTNQNIPVCPSCAWPVVVPARFNGRTPGVSAARLWCPACGHEWEESSMVAVCQAWRTQGRHEGFMARDGLKGAAEKVIDRALKGPAR